jgi:hypothetical protein
VDSEWKVLDLSSKSFDEFVEYFTRAYARPFNTIIDTNKSELSLARLGECRDGTVMLLSSTPAMF